VSEPGIGQDLNEHGESWNDDLAAYLLDALEPAEKRALDEHLSGCTTCTERLRWMAPAVDVLPATVTPHQPPPELKSRLMDVVQRESAMIESAADPERAARADGSSRRRLPRLGGFSLRPALAGIGVFLLLAAGVAGYAVRDSGSSGGSQQVYAAKPDKPDSIASGELQVDGDAGSLHVVNLPMSSNGEVYQAWVQDSAADGGTVHASSVFVVSGDGSGDVAIPHGLTNASRVMVTREPKGGSEHPSQNPLLTAEIN
jgi:Anti-sigma-K factor rskA/Putative zinc-finger